MKLTCEQAMQRLFAYLNRALAGEASDEIEAHLQECLDCCDRLEFSRQLDAFVKSRLPDSPVPVDLRTRILQALAAA